MNTLGASAPRLFFFGSQTAVQAQAPLHLKWCRSVWQCRLASGAGLMAKILVVGASGALGQQVVLALRARGVPVRACQRPGARPCQGARTGCPGRRSRSGRPDRPGDIATRLFRCQSGDGGCPRAAEPGTPAVGARGRCLTPRTDRGGALCGCGTLRLYLGLRGCARPPDRLLPHEVGHRATTAISMSPRCMPGPRASKRAPRTCPRRSRASCRSWRRRFIPAWPG